jgi:hypothetical protein
VSEDTQAEITLLPFGLLMIAGLVLVSFRINHWLYEMSGLPNWWDRE